MSRHSHEPEPSEPVFADQRKWGVRLSTRIKALIILSTLLIAALGVGVIRWVNDSLHRREVAQAHDARVQKALDENDRITRQLRAATQQIKDLAVADQRNVAELACIIISQTPDDPKRPVIHAFRVKYQCPPFSKTRDPITGKSLKPSQPGPTPGSSSLHTPGTVRPAATGSRSSVHALPAPQPSASSSPRPTSHPSPSPSGFTLVPVCQLVPAVCGLLGA